MARRRERVRGGCGVRHRVRAKKERIEGKSTGDRGRTKTGWQGCVLIKK